MVKSDFIFVCTQQTIDPGIALENPMVQEVLKHTKGMNSVTAQLMLATILREEF